MATRGRQLFLKHQCIACHGVNNSGAQGRAPSLEQLYLKRVPLQDGRTVVADDDYLRESIRSPRAKIVAGYRPIMPEFPPEQLDEAELQDLVAYVKSLKLGDTPTRNERTPAPEAKE
jgi:cytochrome c oxidase subunit 2